MAYDTRIFFGTPGSLVVLPNPKGGVQSTRVRGTQRFALGNGEQRTRTTLHGARTFTLRYEALTHAKFMQLQAYAQGHKGPGPWAFLDPAQRNQLTANQSAAGAVTNGTDNFTIAGSGCSIAASTTLVHTDTPRSIAWTFAHGFPGTAYLDLDSPTPGWPGIPVVASRAYSFGCQMRGGGADAVVTYTAQIRWLDTTGAVVSTSSGSGTASASGAFAALVVENATAPATAAYAMPRISYTSGVSAGSIGYFASFQFVEGATVDTTWTPGTGVHPVMIESFEEAWPFAAATEVNTGPVLVLAEDGR